MNQDHTNTASVDQERTMWDVYDPADGITHRAYYSPEDAARDIAARFPGHSVRIHTTYASRDDARAAAREAAFEQARALGHDHATAAEWAAGAGAEFDRGH